MWNSVHFLGCQECHFHIRIYPTYFPKSFPALVLTVSCGAGNSYLFFYSFSLKIIFHIPRGWGGGKWKHQMGNFFFFLNILLCSDFPFVVPECGYKGAKEAVSLIANQVPLSSSELEWIMGKTITQLFQGQWIQS